MDDIKITLNTSKGALDISLYAGDTPITCASFLNLAGKGFYDGLVFHRVIPNFMVQGGCPQGTGTGGPGYKFENECLPHRSHDSAGKLSMANAGPNTNGSQFFLVHQDAGLPPSYTIFGVITEGLDTLDTIANTPVTGSPSGEASRPTERVYIELIDIIESDG